MNISTFAAVRSVTFAAALVFAAYASQSAFAQDWGSGPSVAPARNYSQFDDHDTVKMLDQINRDSGSSGPANAGIIQENNPYIQYGDDQTFEMLERMDRDSPSSFQGGLSPNPYTGYDAHDSVKMLDAINRDAGRR